MIASTVREMQHFPEWVSHVAVLGNDMSLGPQISPFAQIHPSIQHRRGSYFRTLFRLVKILRQLQPEVIHLHLWLPKFFGVQAAVLCKVPVVVTTEHSGAPWTKPSRKLLDRMMTRFITKRIMVCNYIENLFVSNRINPVAKSEIVYNPINLACHHGEQVVRSERAAEEVVFLFIGAIRKVKRLDRLIRSFYRYLECNDVPSSRLIIVGDGPELKKCIDLSIELGIDKNISFELRQFDVKGYYQIADIFVMTSLVEGFSIALAEAMTYGVVPICTDSGGSAELIIDAETGFLLDKNSEEEDYKIFLEVAKSKELRRLVGNRAKSHSRMLTDPDRYIAKILNIYNKE